MIPLALGLLGIGILGTLIQDRGRRMRLKADHQIWTENQLDHSPANPVSRARSAAPAPSPAQIEPQMSDPWHALERDILRWLAVAYSGPS